MNELLSKLENFTERERELFARCLNTLYGGGFIMNQLEKDKPLYRFMLSHLAVFEAYLDYAGWSLRKDEALGVIALHGPAMARFSLNLEETLGLLVLRVLYEEKQFEISLSREKTVKQSEFNDKYKVLTDRPLNKTRYINLLRRFRTLKLLAISGDEADPDALLILYPSITFILDGEAIDAIYERLEKLKATDAGGEDNDESGLTIHKAGDLAENEE